MKKFFLSIFIFTICLVGTYNNQSASAAIAVSTASTGFPSITLTKFSSGFNQPLQITNAGDGTNRLFVVEKAGIVKIISNGSILAKPFLNMTELVNAKGSEQGLLGIAFPPDFLKKRHFFISYTNKAGVGNTVIARYPLTTDSNIADANANTTVLNIPQPFINHNGGQIVFGPDGFLYIGTGDGGGSGDPSNNSQNPKSLLGKILRIDVEYGISPYTLPRSNPFKNEVWAYGLRNPWRFSFDRLTHEIYIADVGQNLIEEVNVQPAGAARVNYGWNIMEGSSCFKYKNCDRKGLTLPVSEYNHTDGDCSITGGYVYRGKQFKTLQGIYIYGDYCSGKIRGLRKNGSRWESKVLLDTSYQISSFGEDEAGNIYFTDFASGDIYKIEV